MRITQGRQPQGGGRIHLHWPPRISAGWGELWWSGTSRKSVPEAEAVLHRRRVLLRAVLPAVIALMAVVLAAHSPRFGQSWRGDHPWTGKRQVLATPAADALSGIDWVLLHQQLLPRWGLGLGWGRGSAEEEAAFEALFAHARRDPNLGGWLLELRAAARSNAARQSRRIEYVGAAWNDYLAQRGVPWYLECNVEVGPGKNRLLMQTYRVLHRSLARVGGRAYPLLVLERADQAGARDGALGRARVHDGVGQVLVGGVREQAELWVWPLLDRQGFDSHPTDDHFAPAVAAELRAGLGPEHFAVLTRTAPAFHALLTLRASLLERQDAGRRWRMNLPPVRGYAPTFRAKLAAMAEADQGTPCPRIGLPEADRIDLESEALARAPGLETALAALTAHLAQGVAVHEARHVADEDQPRTGLRCPDCPPELGPAARAEVSAYLASFADEKTGKSSLYQACHVGRSNGAHALALRYLLPQLLPAGCSEGPPPDLQVRARRLEQTLFHRSERVALQPTSIPLVRRTVRVAS